MIPSSSIIPSVGRKVQPYTANFNVLLVKLQQNSAKAQRPAKRKVQLPRSGLNPEHQHTSIQFDCAVVMSGMSRLQHDQWHESAEESTNQKASCKTRLSGPRMLFSALWFRTSLPFPTPQVVKNFAKAEETPTASFPVQAQREEKSQSNTVCSSSMCPHKPDENSLFRRMCSGKDMRNAGQSQRHAMDQWMKSACSYDSGARTLWGDPFGLWNCQRLATCNNFHRIYGDSHGKSWAIKSTGNLDDWW